ncbi:hypothetical protein V5E97_11405 [Singulisphaera sp. Ch08]|uniref:Lecithin:cholesterol acyltransferase n=1 Tax=Singulisphaera sp. Ch08 TaxID=3120278 RepID=A0AAU7CNE0_9BACT
MTIQGDVVPPHFLVVVPGIMGSRLRDRQTGRVVWVDFSTVPINPLQWKAWVENMLATLAYPNPDLEPAGIMDEVVFAPPWAKQEHYGRLVAALEGMGYLIDPVEPTGGRPALYTFSYDWRQDNRISAQHLAAAINQWQARHPGAKAWILAHSNGGLVARWYIEKLGGKGRVGRLFLLGSPWDGAPRALQMLFQGLYILFRKRFNVFDVPTLTRAAFRTFPCSYQLLPYRNPFLRDNNNELIDLYEGAGWLHDEGQRQLLRDGRRFNEELGTTTSVETICLFGRKRPTPTGGVVSLAAGGSWTDIAWATLDAGDGTVPERSAVHPGAREKIPVVADHGDIYVNPFALEVLQWELMDKFRLPTERERDAAATSRLTITFTPDRDAYSPGEPIALRATIHGNDDGNPVSGAVVQSRLIWRGPLPGSGPAGAAAAAPVVRLWEDEAAGGHYSAEMVAPATEGYYQLKALVSPPDEAAVELEELIAVEDAGGD